MRLAGFLVLAFVASVVAGVLAYGAVSLLPDWDDAAGRGLGEAFRVLLTAVYVILGLILYGLALWRRKPDRHLKRGLLILLLVPFLIVVLGLIDNGTHHIDWLRDRRHGADVHAAMGGRTGAMADPAYLSVTADRNRGKRLHTDIFRPLNPRARRITTA
jgi:hypothetical protein